MSRIGYKTIKIPNKVQASVDGSTFKAKGPLGELTLEIDERLNLEIKDGEINLSRTSEDRRVKSIHGLTRSLAANIVEGVSTGFTRKLQMEGVGYKTELKGQKLMLSLGYSHPIIVIPPDGVQFETPAATQIIVKGNDKQLVGEVAATIRKLRKPEPYKGKGIRYEGEYIRRKAGKTAT